MDYLQIANSWPVWLCAGACVAFIVVQAVAFAKLCYKNAPLVGLSKADCSKSFQCGMVTAIGPSLSCFIGAISMITVVMIACVKLSKKMPWLKEYGLGIAIVIGIVVGALVR